MYKSRNRPMMLLAIVVLAGMSFGQLTNEQKSQLAKASRAIDKAERELKNIGKLFESASGRGGLKQKEAERIERDLVDAKKSIGEAQLLVDGLPTGDEEVATVLKKIGDAIILTQTYEERVNADLKRVGGAEEALLKGYETQMEAVEALSDQVRLFYMGVSGSQFPKERSDGWATLRQKAESMVAAYDGLEGTTQQAQVFERAIRDLKNKLEKAEQAVESAKKSIPSGIKEYLAKIQELKAAALNRGSFTEFSTWIPAYRRAIVVWLYTLETVLDPAAGKALKAEADLQLKEVDRIEKEYFAKIVAENVPPKDNFSGNERNKITELAIQFAQRDNPANQVMKVIITSSDWGRETGWKWDDTGKKWIKVDVSNVFVFVAVKSPDGKHAYLYDIGIEKDHMRNGSMRVWGATIKEKPKSPFSIVLIERIK